MGSHLPRPCRSLLVLLIGLLVPGSMALAGCGDDDQATRTTDGPTTSGRDGTGGDGGTDGDLVVTLDVHGGFVPVEQAVADTADVVVQGDGTVLSPAPVVAIFPGPALQPFQVGHVAVDEVEALADVVASLDPDADYGPTGDPMVADAPDTTVTLRRGTETLSVTANALGSQDGEEGPRAELAAVVERITALPGRTGEELYEPRALRLHDVTEQAGDPPTEGPTSDPTAPGEPTGRILDWPLAHDGAACTIVDDPAAVASALAVLGTATQLDWFRTDLGVRRLVAAPLLPGDPGCTDG